MRIVHSLIRKEFYLTVDWLIRFFFPIYCVGCQSEGNFLCFDCQQKLPPPGGSELPVWILAGFDYQDKMVQRLVWLLKYQKQTAVAVEMAEMLQPSLKEKIIKTNQSIWLVPVPLFWERRFKRGYNQAEILAREIAKLNPENFIVKNKLIKKIKNTAPQAKIKKRNERLENIRGAFILNKKYEKNYRHQSIILIDDVTTTGATLGEIKQLFNSAGVKKVQAIVFAHG